jgi:hypothetical protein
MLTVPQLTHDELRLLAVVYASDRDEGGLYVDELAPEETGALRRLLEWRMIESKGDYVRMTALGVEQLRAHPDLDLG